MEALEEFPKTDIKLKTEKGDRQLSKNPTSSNVKCFGIAYDKDWHELAPAQMLSESNEIVALNKKGKKSNKPVWRSLSS